MRKYILLIVFLIGMNFHAYGEFKYLTFVETDGTKTSVTAVGLSMTFGSDSLAVCNAYTAETKTIALSNLHSMYFSDNDETTGLGHILTDDDIDISHAEAIYTLQGRQLPSGSMPAKGLYILKKGESTRKVQVR